MKDLIYTVEFTTRETASVLDMLRYDGPVVLNWEYAAARPSDGGRDRRFRVTLRGRCTDARWASFGLYPREKV